MVAQTRTGGQPSPKKLKFRDKLVGKTSSTDALQKKLKALHTELAGMDQELVDVQSLGPIRKELISPTILLHRDRGVKALVACCLADLLRLYAPDAPYTENELKDIFQFFNTQLRNGLTGTDAPYYGEYYHLLESLSMVKSVVLICDLPGSDEIIVETFHNYFALVRLDLARNVETFLADILVAIIDECQSLPQDVLQTIMAQFMDKRASMERPGYRLAVQVCNATSDKLQRYVCQYFTDAIVDHAKAEEFDEVRTAHELIQKVNRACPSLLHNVVPQLEEELRVEQLPLRLMATQVLGQMFADTHGVDLVRKYRSTWNSWISRRNDKNAAVRLAWIDAVKGVLINLAEARTEVEESLNLKLFDPDDKVRAAVCKLYSQLDYETALHHVTEKQLRAVAGRGLDKKHTVRWEAMNAIGRLYSLAYPEIENNDPAAIKQFAWIPDHLLRIASTTKEVKAVVEQVLEEYIFPLPSLPSASSSKAVEIDEVPWTGRLLLAMKYMDAQAIKTLYSFSNIKGARPTIYERYLEACIAHNGGTIDKNEEAVIERLNTVVKAVAAQFHDPQKAAEDLHAFAKANESRSYKLLKTCLDIQTDLKTLVKSRHDFFKKLNDSHATLAPTMSGFLRRATLHLVNVSSIPPLVKRVQKGDQHAQRWLTYISKHCPALHKTHIGEFSKAIADEHNDTLIEVSLQALAAVATWDKKLAPNDKRTAERVMRFITGENPRHAKFATRLLLCSRDADEQAEQLVESIADALPEAPPELVVAHLAVLVQLALRAPDAFEQRSDAIMTFLVKNVFPAADAPAEDAMEVEEEWVDDADMTPQLHAKVLALKVCRNRCLAHASSETALELIVKPIVKMYETLLHYSGSLGPDADDQLQTRTRLRLQAAVSMLHLNTAAAYTEEITKYFVTISLTIQDTCYMVRITFLEKLLGMLTKNKLPAYYNMVPFMSVHDPEQDVRERAEAYVLFALRAMPKAARLARFESMFIRFMHLLAHHPDFELTEESLPSIAEYIQFFLKHVASSENIALLYHIAMKAKTVRDAESTAFSHKLYACSELAQHLIKAYASNRSWTLETYPGKIRLPPDILRSLPNAEAVNEVMKTVFLPEHTLTWLAEHTKQTKAQSETKQRAERKPGGKRKASAPKANGSAKRARAAKRRKAASSDEDEPDEQSDSGFDEDEAPSKPSKGKQEEEESSSSEEEEDGDEDEPGKSTRTRAQTRKRAVKAAKRKAKEMASSDG